ncbi:MAG TPA: LysE family translocator [Desulfocapsa sulfexigens]|nr:LysE family translocator [Desulfocapsa sulfexigens]
MLDNLFPFILFVIAMTGTPGPGNLTMMAIGQTSGFTSSIRFLMGTAVGCIFLDTLVASGLGEMITASPLIANILRVGGSLYILYLAVKILRMQFSTTNVNKRFSFFEGLLIHPLSPKSWAMAVVAFSQFMKPEQPLAPQIAIFVFCFLIGLLVFHSSWCAAGALIPRLISSGRLLFSINCIMVTLMIGATGYAMFT